MTKTLEISSIIKERIKNYASEIKQTETGKVLTVADGIAIVSGLYNVQVSEILIFPHKIYGIAQNLESNSVGVILLGDYTLLKEGDEVKRTKKINEIVVGNELLGRIIDPVGNTLDGGFPILSRKTRPTERVALGIMTRQTVFEPIETGILAIDSMIPIGKGQRELIIGDRKTGKTAIALDTIVNQKGKKVKCIYVSIGQKNSTLAAVVKKLDEFSAMKYTTIVSANASDSDALQFLAPYSAMAIAEEWMENGEDVLIVFDDLTKHAIAYRSLSLLLRRPPGREAYPGDVFYLHSRLLERAAKLNKKYGGGSITALPIIETLEGDISAYIPTNVISITDGQIFLVADAFNSGQRPAIDIGRSVSRVGSNAQTKLIKSVSGSLKLKLANFEDLRAFSQFASDLDSVTKKILTDGYKIMTFLKQPQYSPFEEPVQAILLYLIQNDYLQYFNEYDAQEFKLNLLQALKYDKEWKRLVKTIGKSNEISALTRITLDRELKKFSKQFKAKS